LGPLLVVRRGRRTIIVPAASIVRASVVGSTLTAILPAPTAASPTGAALAGTRRASLCQDLALLGRQNLVELGLGFLFELRDLFALILAEVQPFHNERRQKMKTSARAAV
jgi:hypothetical protein